MRVDLKTNIIHSILNTFKVIYSLYIPEEGNLQTLLFIQALQLLNYDLVVCTN